MQAAFNVYTVLEDRANALRPPRPKEEERPAEYWAMYREMKIKDIGNLPEDHPANVMYREREARNAAALKAWEDERDRINDELGINETEAEYYNRVDEWSVITDRILSVPAQTLAGLMVKVRAVRLFEGDDGCDVSDKYLLIVADVETLAKAAV